MTDSRSFNDGSAASRDVEEAAGGRAGLLTSALERGFHDVSDSNHVVGGGGEGEHPTDSFAASVFGLAQASGGLDPTKDLFDELAFLLAQNITIVACCAFVDAAGAAGSVLRHMRRDEVLPQIFHKIERVVTLISTERDALVAARQVRGHWLR